MLSVNHAFSPRDEKDITVWPSIQVTVNPTCSIIERTQVECHEILTILDFLKIPINAIKQMH